MASIECEMCGKKTAKTTKIRVDGAILNVCDDCARFGKPVDAVRSFNLLSSEHSENPKPVTMPEVFEAVYAGFQEDLHRGEKAVHQVRHSQKCIR